jgi:hypothetical protein
MCKLLLAPRLFGVALALRRTDQNLRRANITWFLVLLLFFGQGMVLSAMLQLPRMNRESFWWLHLR